MNNINKKNILKNLQPNYKLPNSNNEDVQLKRNQVVCDSLNYVLQQLLQNDLFIEKALIKKDNYFEGLQLLNGQNLDNEINYKQFLDGNDGYENNLSIYQKQEIDLSSSLSVVNNNDVNFITEFLGYVFIGTKNGLLSVDNNGEFNELIPFESINNFYVHNNSLYVIGNNGISQINFNIENKIVSINCSNINSISGESLYLSNDYTLNNNLDYNITFVGDENSLQYKFGDISSSDEFIKDNNVDGKVTDIIPLKINKENKIIVGSSNGLWVSNDIFSIEGAKNYLNLRQIINNDNAIIKCLFQESYQSIYIGVEILNDNVTNSLYHIIIDEEQNSCQFYRIENVTGTINKIQKFGNTIFVCGNEGFWCSVKDENSNKIDFIKQYEVELPNTKFYSFLVTSDNKYIFGTDKGIYWTNDYTTINPVDQLFGKPISNIISKNNKIYVVYENKLVQLSITKDVETIFKESLNLVQNFNNNNITTVFSYENNIIIGTQNGLYTRDFHNFPIIDIDDNSQLTPNNDIDQITTNKEKIEFIISNNINKIKTIQINKELENSEKSQYDFVVLCTNKGAIIGNLNNNKIFINVSKSLALYNYNVLDCTIYNNSYLVFLINDIDNDNKQKLAVILLNDISEYYLNDNLEIKDNYSFYDADDITSLASSNDKLYTLLSTEKIQQYEISSGEVSELDLSSDLDMWFFEKIIDPKTNKEYYLASFKDQGLRLYENNTFINPLDEINSASIDWYKKDSGDYIKMAIAEINNDGFKNITVFKNIPESKHLHNILFVDNTVSSNVLNVYNITKDNFSDEVNFEKTNTEKISADLNYGTINDIEYLEINNSISNDLEEFKTFIATDECLLYSPTKNKTFQSLSSNTEINNNTFDDIDQVFVLPFKYKDGTERQIIIAHSNLTKNLLSCYTDNIKITDGEMLENVSINGNFDIVNRVIISDNNLLNYNYVYNNNIISAGMFLATSSGIISCSINYNNEEDDINTDIDINNFQNIYSEKEEDVEFNYTDIYLNNNNFIYFCGCGLSSVEIDGNVTEKDVSKFYCLNLVDNSISSFDISQIENPHRIVCSNKYLYIAGQNGLFRTTFDENKNPVFGDSLSDFTDSENLALNINVDYIESLSSAVIFKQNNKGLDEDSEISSCINIIYDEFDNEVINEVTGFIGIEETNENQKIFKSFNCITNEDDIYISINNTIDKIISEKKSKTYTDETTNEQITVEYYDYSLLEDGKYTLFFDNDVIYYINFYKSYLNFKAGDYNKIYFTKKGIFNSYYSSEYIYNLDDDEYINVKQTRLKDLELRSIYSLEKIKLSNKIFKNINSEFIFISTRGDDESGVYYSTNPIDPIEKIKFCDFNLESDNTIVNMSHILKNNKDILYVQFLNTTEDLGEQSYLKKYEINYDNNGLTFSDVSNNENGTLISIFNDNDITIRNISYIFDTVYVISDKLYYIKDIQLDSILKSIDNNNNSFLTDDKFSCMKQFNNTILIIKDNALFYFQDSIENINQIKSQTSVNTIYDYYVNDEFLINFGINLVGKISNLYYINKLNYNDDIFIDNQDNSKIIYGVCKNSNNELMFLLENNDKTNKQLYLIYKTSIREDKWNSKINDIYSSNLEITKSKDYNNDIILINDEYIIKYNIITNERKNVKVNENDNLIISDFWDFNDFKLLKSIEPSRLLIKYNNDDEFNANRIVVNVNDNFSKENNILDITDNFIITDSTDLCSYNNIVSKTIFNKIIDFKTDNLILYKNSDSEIIVGPDDNLSSFKDWQFNKLENFNYPTQFITKGIFDSNKQIQQYLTTTNNKIYLSKTSDILSSEFEEFLDLSELSNVSHLSNLNLNVNYINNVYRNNLGEYLICTNEGILKSSNSYKFPCISPKFSYSDVIDIISSIYDDVILEHNRKYHCDLEQEILNKYPNNTELLNNTLSSNRKLDNLAFPSDISSICNTDGIMTHVNKRKMSVKFDEINDDWINMNIPNQISNNILIDNCDYIENDIVKAISFDDNINYIKAKYSNFSVNDENNPWANIENITTITKTWTSNLKEIYIYLPTTNTQYINHLIKNANIDVFGKTANGDELTGTISDNATKIQITLDNKYYKIDEILDVQINGNSLPLNVFAESNTSLSGEEQLKSQFGYNSLVLPSVCRTAPFKVSDTNIRQGIPNISVDQVYFNFSCFGTDAQAIRIFARSLAEYRIKFNANGALGIMEDQIFTINEWKRLNECNFIYDDHIFRGWTRNKYSNVVEFKNKEFIDKNLTSKNGKTIELFAVWEKYDWDISGATEVKINNTDNKGFIIAKGDTAEGYGNVILSVDTK